MGSALLWKGRYDATPMQTDQVSVRIDLGRIRQNAVSVAQKTGVDVIAVVKADAYGLGASQVAKAIGDVVSGFCVFALHEAQSAGLRELSGKPVLCLGPNSKTNVQDLIAAGARPAVWTVDEARRLRSARPIVSVDTGMQRFACPASEVAPVIEAGEIDEAFTHATRLEHVEKLLSVTRGRVSRMHAAASALLDQPRARLDAVRPGMALYRGVTRISCRLVEARDSDGPAGYSGFTAPRFGVILCGYSNGLRRGICLVNGQRRAILEVGMQTAFVELGPGDSIGDEVLLLGDGLTESEIGSAWQTSEQLVLQTLASAGIRSYVNP
jgi:alanine racemase